MSEYIIRTTNMPEHILEAVSAWYEIDCEIVRCRDCKHYHAEINGCDEFGDIWHDEYANVEPDGFCKWGERREQ